MSWAKFGQGFVWALLGGLVTVGPIGAQEILPQSASGSQAGTRPAQKPVASAGSEADAVPSDGADQGPVRMARFAEITGDVSWRGDDTMDWAKAVGNLPIRQDAQVWVTHGGRAVVQFDDGSELRLGNGALVTLKALDSDTTGESTQLTLREGLVTLVVRHPHSVYQIDTPLASVKTEGPSQVRTGVDHGVELAVQRGRATVEGERGTTALESGSYLYLADTSTVYHVQALPQADGWDRWNEDLNGRMERSTESAKHLPSSIALVAGNLDDYGAWHEDSRYGAVWAPRVSTPDWRPYSAGRWTWVEPYGWTWVSEEPWGWAPYHYGTWISEPYGWAWCPGPVNQYWSPGVVGFTYCDGVACWAPLAPWEVVYPSYVSCGFGFGAWSLFFSIGGCGVWYPGGWNSCYCHPFHNSYCNRWGYGRLRFGEGFGRRNGWGGHTGGVYARGRQFVPYNARKAAGATRADVASFGGRGGYRAAPGGVASALFARGKAFGGPDAGRIPVSGPPSVQPTRESVTPTRAFTSSHPTEATLARTVYHAPSPSGVRHALSAGGEGTRSETRLSNPAVNARAAVRGLAGMTPDRSNRGTFGRASERSLAYSDIRGGIGGRNLAPAEAARRARTDLGLLGGNGGSGRGSTDLGSYRNVGGNFGYGSYGGGRNRNSYGDSGGGGRYGGGRIGGYSGGNPGYSGRIGGYSGGNPGSGGRIGGYSGGNSGSGGRIGGYSGGSGGGGGRTGGSARGGRGR